MLFASNYEKMVSSTNDVVGWARRHEEIYHTPSDRSFVTRRDGTLRSYSLALFSVPV
jgi:hypothetical protein